MANELDPSLELWRTVIATRAERAIRNSALFLDGYPAGGSGGGISTESGGRTETLGLKHAYGHEVKEDGPMSGPDDKHGALRRRIERWVREGADLCDHLAPSNRAQSHMQTLASDACPSGCCESCWRVGTKTPTRNPGGRLCRWCGDMARTLDMDDPPRMLVEKHAQGRVITDRDVRLATGGKHG